ncbi:MAG TPA: DNA repair protein RecO [Candidatus Saccharimonadia bacterium]|nr:DNA repair protein RecO [Candidatus Saccharimonadia bacterium]
MKRVVTTGIILRRLDYLESDRIITCITPDIGKISLLTKGVRKPKSKLAGSIELFSESQITFLLGNGDMGTLLSGRLVSNFAKIITSLDRTELAYSVVGLLNRNIEAFSGSEYYDLLKQTLQYLNNFDIKLEMIKIWFGLNFLEIYGNGPNQNSIDNLNKDSKNFTFNLDTMNFIAKDNGEYSVNDVKTFRLAISSNPSVLSRIQNDQVNLGSLVSLISLIMRSNNFEY